MSASKEASVYLARVLPWPEPGEEGYVNIHYPFTKPGDSKPMFPGYANRSVYEACKHLVWLTQKRSDVYVCMSVQRHATPRVSRGGYKYLGAVRNQDNALKLKSLFIDVDLKGGDNGYNTTKELTAALAKFVRDSGLPKPTIVVFTGGGVHVYWTMTEALSVAEWQPLADSLAEATRVHGLKCDAACTIDSARLLRVPDTANWKTGQPRPVRILSHQDFDYLKDRLASPLERFPVTRRSRAGKEPASFLEAPDAPPRPPIEGISDLAAGIEERLIDLVAVTRECPFLQHAVLTGGKDNSQSLWNLTTLAAAFAGNGRVMAHMLGRQHPGYTRESTNEMYDRKVEERRTKGLGWPSCQAFASSGAKECQGCKHLAQGKSPLNFEFLAQVKPNGKLNGHVHPLGASSKIQIDALPPGYSRDGEGFICTTVHKDDGSSDLERICDYPMTDPWLQKHPWILHFQTKTDNPTRVAVPYGGIHSSEFHKDLQKQGVVLHRKEINKAGEFFVSWIKTLKEMKNAVINTAPFGWNHQNGAIEGFVYGDNVWTPQGSRLAPYPDPVLANHYTPVGTLEPWTKAATFITSQGRPELNAIIASAFASPLVSFVYEPGLLLSAYSAESGIGKTTASKIAQAVWGDPIRGRQYLDDTQNSVASKLGEIRALPLYWDELKTEEQYRKFVTLVFQLSLGKDKSRLSSSAKLKDVGVWQTMLVATSNDSLLDYVLSRTRMTTAGLYRVFEYEVPAGTKNIALFDASELVGQLNTNYGQAGLVYSKFLGENFDRIGKEVGEFHRELATEVNCQTDERFWIGLITCLCVGAKYASELELVDFDVAGLRSFLITVLGKMRGEAVAQPVDMKQGINVSNILAQFINAMRSRHMLVTNKIHVGAGKPVPGSITMQCAIDKLDGVYVHVGHDDKLMRISSTFFSDWLQEKGYSRHAFTRALADEMSAKQIQGRIGAGTSFTNAKEYLIEIDLAGTKLANFLDEA